MKMISAVLLFVLLNLNISQAQDAPLEIIGENYYEVCAPWCQDFQLYLDENYTWENVSVSISPNIGASITVFDSTLFTVCIDLPGTYYLEASGFAFGPGGEFFASDSIFIFANEFFIEGEIISDVCPMDTVERGECLKVCEFTEATYYADFYGQTFDGFWTISGAQSFVDNITSVDVVWGEAGMGTVSFSPINGYCTTEPLTVCVDILPTPEPYFESLPEATNSIIQLCTGQPLYLENLSEHASRYEWTFGDGATSELFEPEHSYDTPGFYTIELTAFNMCDCEASYFIEVEVLPAPAPELSCIATVCPEDKVRYVASTDGCQTFYWTVSSNGTILSGGGTDDDFVEIEWGAGPDGIIELMVEDCNQDYCDKPAIFRIPIVSENGPISGDPSVCSGELVTYKAPYFPGVTYTWSTSPLATIISGQNTNAISVQWANVFSVRTDQSVSVTYGHCYLGCEGSDQFDVSIVPNLSILANSQFCAEATGNFISRAGFGTLSNVDCDWELINNEGITVWSSTTADDEVNVALTYPSGDYTMVAVPVIPSDVCQDRVEHDFIISALPPEPFGIIGDSIICAGSPYAFEIQNAGAYQTHWVVTDGASQVTYDGQIITHTFGVNPPYLIEAMHGDVVYPACLSDAVSKTIQPATVAEILGSDENCLEENTIYEVYDLPGNILEWRVEPADMAEVSNKNSQQAEFYWVKDGNAQVILSVCGQDLIKNVKINPLPAPQVNYPAGLCKNEVANVSTTVDFQSQVWKDEDGTEISSDSTTALYPGFYSVEVTDLNGCVGTTSFEIEFYPTPTARISTLGENGHCNVVDPIELVANTDGVNYSYQWYENGMPVGTNSPKHIADTFGYYQVEATNQYGCSVISNSIRLFNWCDGRPGVCSNYACVYYGDLVIANSEIDCNTKKYEEVSGLTLEPGSAYWEIENSDGLFERKDGTEIEHTYVDAGYYTVIVLARLDGFVYPQPDCRHLVYIKDTVELASRFDYHGACANSTIEFEDLSTFLPDYGITGWAWDFGDGGTSTDQHPDHIYTASGNYLVTLVTTSTSGCTSTATQMVEVFAEPVLNILALAEACEENPVRFEVSSTAPIFDITWDFLDPAGSHDSANSQVAFHAYENSGLYTPTVSASNIYTCVAEVNTNVEIFNNDLTGDITSSNGTVLCEGENTDLIAPPGGIIWNWNTLESTSQINIDEAGYYEVLIEDNHGCQYVPDPIFIEIQPKPVATINGREVFGPGDVGHWQDTIETCEGIDIELKAFANSGVTYLWSTSATSETISFTEESSTLLPPGLHVFDVVVTDATTNCVSDPATIVIIVHDKPQNFTVSLQSGSLCSETPNIFQVDNVEADVVYTWSDGQEGWQIEAFEQGLYTVVATNQYGCTNEAINSLFIKPSPRADLIPSGCFTRCNPDTICIPQIDNVTYFEILLDNVVQESGTTLPDEYIATESGSYEFYLESSNGCSATSQPLDLELYPGYGDIEIFVFVDVNGNGFVDAGDTTISDIAVLLHEGGVLYNSVPTNGDGSAYFLNVPVGIYVASIDTSSLPANLSILLTNQVIEIVGCGLEYSDTLVCNQCLVSVSETVMVCPGDSVILADTVFFPVTDFTYYLSGGGLSCDTLFQIEVLPDTTARLHIYTYFDSNKNGLWESTDSLVGNIPIFLTDMNSNVTNVSTDNNGNLVFHGDTGQWQIQIDGSNIPAGWEIVLGDTIVMVGPCEEVFLNLLLGPLCLPVKQHFELDLCRGDSILLGGIYYSEAQEVELTIAGGTCDSIKTYSIVAAADIDLLEIPTDACEGETNGAIEIQASSINGPVSINWSHSTSNDFEILDLSPNTYSYTLFDGICQSQGVVTIGEYIFPALEISDLDPSCPGSTDGQISIALASSELSWSLDEINYSTEDFVDLEAGIYTVFFSNGNCIQTEQVTLEERDIDLFDIQTVVDVPFNTEYQITHNYLDSLAHAFNWSPANYLDCSDCPGPIFTGADGDVTVFVVVTDNEGCEQSAELLLRADQSQHIYIPNAFSPNDDAINDHFKPYVREGVVSTEQLEIFDRWGNRVYQEKISPDALDIRGWNGQRNGNTYLPGLFIYKADFVYSNGKTKQMTGEVHLVR